MITQKTLLGLGLALAPTLLPVCHAQKLAEPKVSKSKSKVQKEADSAAQPPALFVKDRKGVRSPLAVEELAIDVQLVGNTAVTTMTMVFRNDTDRVLQGELVFPLGEGRTVSGYALEVNGKMRSGVVVPKELGRVAYENTVRGEIDPGLAEWTKGNNFRTKIYPIPAKGTKRVSLSFEETLRFSSGSYVYQLP